MVRQFDGELIIIMVRIFVYEMTLIVMLYDADL
jgi:hypothetical protein